MSLQISEVVEKAADNKLVEQNNKQYHRIEDNFGLIEIKDPITVPVSFMNFLHNNIAFNLGNDSKNRRKKHKQAHTKRPPPKDPNLAILRTKPSILPYNFLRLPNFRYNNFLPSFLLDRLDLEFVQ